jgi:hypothetical protein
MQLPDTAKQHEAKTAGDAFLDFAALKPRIPVCERTLRDWVRTGKLPSVKMARLTTATVLLARRRSGAPPSHPRRLTGASPR